MNTFMSISSSCILKIGLIQSAPYNKYIFVDLIYINRTPVYSEHKNGSKGGSVRQVSLYIPYKWFLPWVPNFCFIRGSHQSAKK